MRRSDEYLWPPWKASDHRRRDGITFCADVAAVSDPAAGSGNFLTESYLSLRRLENDILRETITDKSGTGVLGFEEEEFNPIQVTIQQFYGIEINDFAVSVAKTAIWIAEAQMFKETEAIIHKEMDFLPLHTNANIHEGNALQMDWNDVIPAGELSYIMGNPPFVGARLMSKEQKKDTINVFGADWVNVGNLDYVSNWFKIAVDYIRGTEVKTAFVSTNSVSQGSMVSDLWRPLFDGNLKIFFAHRTFKWNSESIDSASVFCVIVGFTFSKQEKGPFLVYAGTSMEKVANINPYLFNGPNIFIGSRSKAITPRPPIGIGNKPVDGGGYLFTKSEMEDFIAKEPNAKSYFKLWYGAKEWIANAPRYCLWLGKTSPSVIKQMPYCLERVNYVRNFRLNSKSAGTRKLADTPTRFHVENMPKNNFIIVPKTSSENRRYLPIGFASPEILVSDAVFIITDAELSHFGILISNVHMAWMRTVCGRLKSDYRYSKDIVYNNFPWPTPTAKQKERIEKTAQGILDARALYPNESLAALYDPTLMPKELRYAHRANDKAVMDAYGFSTAMTEEDCVAELLKLYEALVHNEQ
nr:DNA methyltransferase [Veillonella magna]